MDLSDETFIACADFLAYLGENIKDKISVIENTSHLPHTFCLASHYRAQGKASISTGVFVLVPLVQGCRERSDNLLTLRMVRHRMNEP